MAATDHSLEAAPPVPDTPGTPDAVELMKAELRNALAHLGDEDPA